MAGLAIYMQFVNIDIGQQVPDLKSGNVRRRQDQIFFARHIGHVTRLPIWDRLLNSTVVLFIDSHRCERLWQPKTGGSW